jgi:hypothetical protein
MNTIQVDLQIKQRKRALLIGVSVSNAARISCNAGDAGGTPARVQKARFGDFPRVQISF